MQANVGISKSRSSIGLRPKVLGWTFWVFLRPYSHETQHCDKKMKR